jgi:tRNA threonylcarbamoyladenosine biosynthesis protein TsaE
VLSLNVSKTELAGAATKIAEILKDEVWFNIAINGEMGAGKTTFSGFLLHALGVPSSQPVTSPTFTYLNEYKTSDGHLLAHLDMYRAVSPMTLEDLGASDQRLFWGILVEWPDSLVEPVPTHQLDIGFTDKSEVRSIRFTKC